jgi:hypothetical protein
MLQHYDLRKKRKPRKEKKHPENTLDEPQPVLIEAVMSTHYYVLMQKKNKDNKKHQKITLIKHRSTPMKMLAR